MKINRRKSILALLLAPFGFKAAVAMSNTKAPIKTDALYWDIESKRFAAHVEKGTWTWIELTDPSTYPKGAGDIRSYILPKAYVNNGTGQTTILFKRNDP